LSATYQQGLLTLRRKRTGGLNQTPWFGAG
jgi:hypothetical protein